MTYILLSVALTMNAVANILMKLGSRQFAEGLSQLFHTPRVFFSNVYFFLGLCFFAVSIVLYSLVLSRLYLSIAYPIMTGMGFLIVVTASVLGFHEQLFWWQWVGIVFILSGVILLSQGASAVT